jgi:hypothetical protein
VVKVVWERTGKNSLARGWEAETRAQPGAAILGHAVNVRALLVGRFSCAREFPPQQSENAEA